MTDDDRIEYLEQENARLHRQLGHAGVAQLPRADTPDADELAALHRMILQAHPVTLTCPINQFERSLLALCYARRQSELNNQFFPTKWLDDSREWLRAQGYSTDVSLRSFVAAAIASGVRYSPLDRFPFDIELGLARGDGGPSSAWRAVLESGKLPAPTPLKRAPYPEQPISTIHRSDDTDARGRRGIRIERS
jgi:hypothetical protein